MRELFYTGVYLDLFRNDSILQRSDTIGRLKYLFSIKTDQFCLTCDWWDAINGLNTLYRQYLSQHYRSGKITMPEPNRFLTGNRYNKSFMGYQIKKIKYRMNRWKVRRSFEFLFIYCCCFHRSPGSDSTRSPLSLTPNQRFF